MNLLEFTKRFPDEASCRAYLRTKREEHGITCKKCNGTKHYWLRTIEKWKCAACGSRTNLKAGTMLSNSQLPVRYWLGAILLLTSTKNSISSVEVQTQLGHKYYEPIWYMIQKLRIVMGNRDEEYQLKGEIEIDDSFFEVTDRVKRDNLGKIIPNKENQKRGRGSQRQAKVLVIVESTSVSESKGKHHKDRIMGRVKMIVMDELTSGDINEKVQENVNSESTLLSDGYRSYNRLKEVIKNHKQMVIPASEAHKVLPWVHTIISNAKSLFLGIHHSIRREYLQNYLNTYCYKLNRRHGKVDIFDRLLSAGVSKTWY